MFDEDTGAEPKILSASIADPYLLVIRDDASAFVAEMNKDFELEEIERENETLVSTKWVTGCLYHDTQGIFSTSPAEATDKAETIFMFLLSEAGQLHVRRPAHIIPCASHTHFGSQECTANFSRPDLLAALPTASVCC